MKREEVIKIINDDPHLTVEQGAAILERYNECENNLFLELLALEDKNLTKPETIRRMFVNCFNYGYVYASLELNGEVKV